MLHLDFYEKALFVKPTWRPRCVMDATALPFALCFYSHSRGAHTLWWLGAQCEIRLFEPKALQSSDRPSRRVDQVQWRSRL